MKATDLIKLGTFTSILNCNDLNLIGYYNGDLLSWVMGHLKDGENCLLTILNSINVIAVSTLLEVNTIIFCDGVIPTDDIITKAKEENINLLSTNLSSAKALKVIYEYENSL